MARRGKEEDVVARLTHRVRVFLKGMETASEGLVVAVSGGPDSVALLRVLILARGRSETPLVVAHLNHQLRGAESAADEAFVAELHADLLAAGVKRLALVNHRLNVAELARAGRRNLEAQARKTRYEWLAEVARNHGLHHVATGHIAEDQAETVLHRLLRGTGIQGLRGIAARRPLTENVTLVRPLLETARAEVLSFLAALGQPYRTDSSNSDLRFTRNRLRHDLLPRLAREYNPAVVAVLGRLARQADEAHREALAAATAFLQEAERPRAGKVLVFERAALASRPRSLVRAVLRMVWEREGWPLSAMDFAAWERLTDLVLGGSAADLDLPGPVHARRRERVVQLIPGGVFLR
jgi:tRNA(Ile)-lysidine synthase